MIRRARWLCLLLGALGVVGLLVGLWCDPARTTYSYLTAVSYAVSVALGALLLLMIELASGARWFVVLRRLVEAPAVTFPLLAVAWAPLGLAFLLGRIHPWALAAPGFVARSALYFAVWIAVGELLRRWSLRQQEEPARIAWRLRALAAGGFWPIGLTLTFAAFDWLMALEPGWRSTIFGLYFFAGGLVGGTALVVLLAFFATHAELLGSRLNASHFYALGRLLLTFVIFWAYIAFSQLLIIWEADLPAEVPWYILRWEQRWRVVAIFLICGHFFLPFLALLSYRLKRRPESLAAIAAWLLAAHYADLAWVVLPEQAGPGGGASWLDLAALLGVAGCALAFLAWRLGRQPLLAEHDPELATSLAYESR
jgi:hypothetical protein